MSIRLRWLLFLTLSLAGCASTPLPVGTLVLGQVAHIATKDDTAHGVTVDGTALLVPPYLLHHCALDLGSLESGDLAVLRVLGFWWRDGHVSSSLWWAVVPKGMVISPDDFVEVELKDGVGDERCSMIARVRSPAGESGECGFDRSERVGPGALRESFLDAMHTPGAPGHIGPPTSVSIYAMDWRRKAGQSTRPARTAPSSGASQPSVGDRSLGKRPVREARVSHNTSWTAQDSN